ncbi:MAG: hypothetical protein ACD_19C00426G0010 [uncultured bacterium]|nr:MAG: hypothetical protein ACD_19C00426G0010 [uncultured bacterium]
MNIVKKILFQNKQWSEGRFKTFGFKRDIFEKVWRDLNTKLIALITGPRRVGKSVLLKQIANELIVSKKISPKQILFYEFAQNDDEDTIWDVFEYFTKEMADPRLPIFIFFDEIQYVNGYESMIKNIYDNQDSCKIFITGSLSLSYKKRMSESLTGRFFSYKLFPLNFLEFIKLHKPSSLDIYNKTIKEDDKFKREYQLSILNADFREFLISGRYPEAFGLSSEQNKIYLSNIINQSLNEDAYAYFRIEKPSIMNSLFEYIRQNNGGLLSINKLSSLTGSSNKTISTYLDILELMGIVYIVYNSTNPLIKNQSSKKAYINSSFAFDNTKLDVSTALGFAVESYILERLLEKGEIVTFWRKREKEIDFLIPSKKIGYEIKFRPNVPTLKHAIKDYEIETVSLNEKVPACLF